MKKIFGKNEMVTFFKEALLIKDLLNLERVNSGFLSDQYLIAFNPNLCVT